MIIRYSLFIASLVVVAACADPTFNSAGVGRTTALPGGSVQKPNGSYEVRIQFLKSPAVEGDSQFFLIFSNNTSKLSVPISVEIKTLRLWMPSMGHGSAPVKIEDLGGGVFQVSHVFFIMPGDWQIQLRYHILKAEGESSSDEQSLNFDFFIN